jgi:hypothetical protein
VQIGPTGVGFVLVLVHFLGILFPGNLVTTIVNTFVLVTTEGLRIDQRVTVRVGVTVVVPRTEVYEVGVGASTVSVVVCVEKATAVSENVLVRLRYGIRKDI